MHLNPAPHVTLDPTEWMPRGASGSQLHLWEAFVCGPGHARAVNGAGLEPHVQDAATAALAFVHREGIDTWPNSDITAANPFSTVSKANRKEPLSQPKTSQLRPVGIHEKRT